MQGKTNFTRIFEPDSARRVTGDKRIARTTLKLRNRLSSTLGSRLTTSNAPTIAPFPELGDRQGAEPETRMMTREHGMLLPTVLTE